MLLPDNAKSGAKRAHDCFEPTQGSSFTSRGTPLAPVTFVPVSLVTEGPYDGLIDWFSSPGYVISFLPDYWPNEDYNPTGDPPPTLEFHFSNLYQNSGLSQHFASGMAPRGSPYVLECPSVSSALNLTMKDCGIYNGWFSLGEPNGYVVWQVAQPNWPPDWEGGDPIPGAVSLFNNLFDSVYLNLDPDTGPLYWSGCWRNGNVPTPTVTLSLSAVNNLFYGGWLYMVPANNTPSQWTVENNLFYKVVFAQESHAPLDYDFNAYWPCTDDELYEGQAQTLQAPASAPPDRHGTGDLTLAAAPLFESGPLGRFYLPAGSSLIDRGSKTADLLGLYHYTTRTTQTKELASTADIGLHYIAVNAQDPNKGKPIDGDTDGIPDYVENWHGDGRYDLHTDTETSWLLSETIDGTADALNTIYDDVDLDGDGMVGRVEKALKLSPQSPLPLTPNNPLLLKQVTTAKEPDIVAFQVPIQRSLVDLIGRLHLLVDGTDTTLQSCDIASDGTGESVLIWNTTYEPPGQHSLQAVVFVSGASESGSVTMAFGPLVQFSSPNVAQFDPLCSQYTPNSARLFAKLPQMQAAYRIELRDPSKPTSDPPIRVIEGTTASGSILESWSPTSDNYAGNSVSAVFSVQFAAPPRAGFNTQLLHSTSGVQDGDFDVAYLSDNDEFGQRDGPRYNAMLGVVDILMAPWFDAVEYGSGFNHFTREPGTITAEPGYLSDRRKVTEVLLPSLAANGTRNFFCEPVHSTPFYLEDGRGSPGITFIEVDEVASALGNTSNPFSGIAITHPYRLVFLDGCSTAFLKTWSHAFGIYDSDLFGLTDGGNYWDPQAFVGWAGPANGPSNSELWNQYAETLKLFFSMWMNGRPLAECIEAASDRDTRPYGDARHLEFPLPVPKNADLFIRSPRLRGTLTSELRVYGYRGITRYGATF